MVWLSRTGELIGKLHVWEIDEPKTEAKPPENAPIKLTWKAEKPISHPDFDLRNVTFSPDGKKFAVSTSLTSLRFDQDTLVFATDSCEQLYRVKGGFPRFVGNDLYTWNNEVVQYDVQTGKRIKSFPVKAFPAVPASDNPLFRCQISPDGNAVAGWFTGIIARVIDIKSGTELVRLEGQELPDSFQRPTDPRTRLNFQSMDAAWSPDSKRLAELYPSNNERTGGLAVWDTKTGKQIARLPIGDTPLARFMCFTFSRDGKWLVVGGLTQENQDASSLTILDAETLKPDRKRVIDSRDGGADVTAIAYSPDGGTIAVAVNLLTGRAPMVRILLCDAKSLEAYDTLLPDHDTAPISSLAYSPEGKTLIAATGSLITIPERKEILHKIIIWRGEVKSK